MVEGAGTRPLQEVLYAAPQRLPPPVSPPTPSEVAATVAATVTRTGGREGVMVGGGHFGSEGGAGMLPEKKGGESAEGSGAAGGGGVEGVAAGRALSLSQRIAALRAQVNHRNAVP